MSQEFSFQCPHCQETIRITDDVMGEIVDCPICGNPFKVEIPSARPSDPSQLDEEAPLLDRPDRGEGKLQVAHPAMLRSHPIKFIGCCALVAAGVAGVALPLFWDLDIISRTVQLAVAGLLLLTGLGFLGAWWLQTRYTTLTITTKRTILRRGLIAKNTTEVQHDDVRNIQVEQNMYQRLVNVGDVAVSSSGQDDLEINVDGVPEPDQLADTIRDLQ